MNTECIKKDECNELARVAAQYNAVVEQNASLQKTVSWQKEQMQKDNDYLVKTEEANMLYEQDVEALKKQVDALQEELSKYKRAVEKVDDLTVSEIKKGLSIDDINNLQGRNAQLQCENENLRTAYNDILTSCKNEQQKNEQFKKALIDIKAMVEFECKCSDKETCICHVCDKYDAILNKIKGCSR